MNQLFASGVETSADHGIAEDQNGTIGIGYLRLSITDSCNQHCIYCSAAGCCPSGRPILSSAEMCAAVRLLAGVGISKVRITGGEPTMRGDLPGIIRAVVDTPGVTNVGLTTNGLELAKLAHGLKSEGISSVNVSLDSLNRAVYQRITGTDGLAAVLDGIHAAVECGFASIKTNTVVMRGINDGEIGDIAALACSLPIEVRFIELMPLKDSAPDWEELFVGAGEIRSKLGGIMPVASEEGSSAKLYRMSGARGRIGIIAPVTERFCGSCNRIRLTCSGLLKPCLKSAVAYDIVPIINDQYAEDRFKELLEQSRQAKLSTALGAVAPIQVESMASLGG